MPEGIILPGRTAPAASATPGRIFVIFIDDLHIRPPDTPLIHRVMDLLPETLIHEGDEFGIISSGKSAIRVQMTSDRNRLRAIDRAVGEAFDPRQLIERATQLSSLGESRWRAHVAFKTAIETVRGLEQIRHRRKAFLYVSAGYNFNPFDDSRVNARIESMQQVGFFEGVDLPEFDEPALDQFATTDAFGEVFSDSELHNELLLLTRRGEPRQCLVLYDRRPRSDHHPGSRLRSADHGVERVHPQAALVAADAGRADRWDRGGEPQHVPRGVHRDRRRDERLLRARLLFVEPRRDATDARAAGGGGPRRGGGPLADPLPAAVPRCASRGAARRGGRPPRQRRQGPRGGSGRVGGRIRKIEG